MEEQGDVRTDVSPGEAEGDVEHGAEVEKEDAGGGEQEQEKRVPVSESIRYRRRAQAAEQRLAEMEGQLKAAEASLSETQQALRDVERRQKVDALLQESEAVDLEAARLLTEAAVSQMDEPDVEAAVEELRTRKPYLFRRSADGGRGGEGSMAARRRGGGAVELTDAAEAAATSGQRQDLLRYLRMRRRRR